MGGGGIAILKFPPKSKVSQDFCLRLQIVRANNSKFKTCRIAVTRIISIHKGINCVRYIRTKLFSNVAEKVIHGISNFIIISLCYLVISDTLIFSCQRAEVLERLLIS